MMPGMPRWRRLLNHVGSIAGSPATAEDIVQSAFLRVWEKSATSAIGDMEAYLARTALNLALDERRQRARWPMGGADDLAAIRCELPLPDETAASRQQLTRLGHVLAGLPSRSRQALVMNRLEGYRTREIAASMGISTSAVEKHIARAVVALSVALADDPAREP